MTSPERYQYRERFYGGRLFVPSTLSAGAGSTGYRLTTKAKLISCFLWESFTHHAKTSPQATEVKQDINMDTERRDRMITAFQDLTANTERREGKAYGTCRSSMTRLGMLLFGMRLR